MITLSGTALIEAAEEAVAATFLRDLVTVSRREKLFGSGQLLELEDTPLPAEYWSRGERLFWDFLRSLAGQGPVSLGQFVGYFRNPPSDLEFWAQKLFAAAWSREPSRDETRRTAHGRSTE